MVFFRAQSLVQFFQTVLFYSSLFETISRTTTLSPEERSELARKFKYYHRSVRPGDRYNLVETINGTFFSLHAEVELLKSRQSDDHLNLEIVMTLHYNDDRLILRELSSVLSIPAEFQPWLPDIEIRPSSEVKQSYHLDPKTGQVTIIYRLAPTLPCDSERWRYPFEKYSCELNIVASEDERIFLRLTRDLRPDAQIMLVKYATGQWPHLVFRFTYSAQWQSAIVNVYVPSILIFSVVAFAQWKRRKTQVTVTVASLISMLLLHTSNRKHGSVTMQDVWTIGVLIHVICVLTVDLLLPSRRIIYTTITTRGIPVKASASQGSSVLSKPVHYASIRNSHTPHKVSSSVVTPSNATMTAADELRDPDVYDASASLLMPSQYTSFPSHRNAHVPLQRRFREFAFGRRKRLALTAILLCYCAFSIGYFVVALYIVSEKL